MDIYDADRTCRFNSFLLAALIGVLAALILRFLAGVSWTAALFCGLLLLFALGVIFTLVFCKGRPAAQSAVAQAAKPARSVPKPVPTPEPAAFVKTPEPVADPEPVAPTAEEPAAATTPAEVDYDGDGKIEGKDEGTRPEALSAARDGKADNLKEIKGIGPKMEKLCNSLGFYHFDQIANWSPDEVAWVNANLEGFRGRVTRDEWVEQAKILAEGGETDFSKKVEDGKVY